MTNEKLDSMKDFLSLIVHKNYYRFIKNELEKYTQHGHTSTFKHSREVAYRSYCFSHFMNRLFNINFDYDALVTASYLHDFFMYDWHEKTGNHKLHGFTHAHLASENAKKYCDVSDKISSIIESHMWPLNLTKIPKSREAFVVCVCDKVATVKEVLMRG